MSAATESLTDWLVDRMRSEDGSTLVWRMDGSTIAYFDFEEPGVFLIEVKDAKVEVASNQESRGE